MQTWLYNNLQQWTPFSALIVVAGIGCMAILVYDVVASIAIQPFVVGVLTLVIGSSGTATLFQHGVNVANGVATSTARAVVQEAQLVSQPLPPDSSKGGTAS